MPEPEKDQASQTKIWKSLIPLFLIVAVACLYLLSIWLLVQCPFGGCSTIDTRLIAEIDQNRNVSLANVANTLKKKSDVLDAETEVLKRRTKVQREKEADIANTEDRIVEKYHEIANLRTANQTTDVNAQLANVNALRSDVNSQSAELEILKTSANRAIQNQNTAVKDLVAAGDQVSSRYSSRLFWLFVVGVFFSLSIAITIYCGHVIHSAFKSYGRAKWLWALALVVGLLLFLIGLLFPQFFTPFTRPLFDQSIFANGDVPSFAVVFSNSTWFVSIVMAVAASCTIIYVSEKNRDDYDQWLKREQKLNTAMAQDDKAGESKWKSELEKLPAAASSDRYQLRKRRARIILYIGSGMLFAGLLQLKILSNWHLLFVDAQSRDLLGRFLQDYLTVLAGFFTIILASIYVPMAYFLPNEPDLQESLEDKGFITTFNDFAPRIVAVLLPLLAPAVGGFLKNFFHDGV